MTFSKRISVFVATIALVVPGVIFSGPASAVPNPTNAVYSSNFVIETSYNSGVFPTFTSNGPSPAFSMTATGIGIAGFVGGGNCAATPTTCDGYRLWISPAKDVVNWAPAGSSVGWTVTNTCVSGSNPFGDCGISRILLNGTDISAGAIAFVNDANAGMIEVQIASANRFLNSSGIFTGNVTVEMAAGAWTTSTDSAPFKPSLSVVSASAVQGISSTPSLNAIGFRANGGSGSMDWLTVQATPNSLVTQTLPASTFTRTGYGLMGWAGSPTGSVEVGDAGSHRWSGSKVLYAIWAPYVDVQFDPNGGSGTMATQTNYKTTRLTPNAFTRSGYTFAGWTPDAAGAGFKRADNAYYAFNASTTFYAQWTPVAAGNSATGTAAATTPATSSSTLAKTGGSTLTLGLVSLGSVLLGYGLIALRRRKLQR